MRYSVILVPDDEGLISVSIPALPGCVSMGHSREEALAHARDAILGWNVLPTFIFRRLLRTAGMTVDEFIALL